MHPSALEVVKRLSGDLAGSPLLVMGQTVFWDEPTKALLRRVLDAEKRAGAASQAPEVEILAGIHDVDYFSRLRRPRNSGKFVLTGHDDGLSRARLPRGEPSGGVPPGGAACALPRSTSDLWVSAAEASQLFGSETVITRALLNEYGISIDKLGTADTHEELIVEATQAWGWRGVAMDAEEPPIAVSVRVKDVLGRLSELVHWAASGRHAS